MNILVDGKITMVENNPPHCNNLTEVCAKRCSDESQLKLPEEDRCKYHREVKAHQRIVHGTEQELEFQDGLGTFSLVGRLFPKTVLTRDYLISIRGRKRWGTINPNTVKEHARKLLMEM